MKKNESVTHVMTANPISVGQHESVSVARHLMQEKNIHHLPVTDGDKLVGILTANDFLRVSFGEFGNQDGRSLDAVLDHTYKISDLMVSQPVSINQSETVREAARILAASEFHSLPVVDGSRLVGIVTSSDLIQYLLSQY
ncbi:MAG: CBS domain-containing protein [Planctomycetaceae bacterium]